jgi:hypothetical protein
MEAEYMAAAKTALWMRKLMATVQDGEDTQGIELRCDNQAALALMRNPMHHQRAKHIDVCHHFLQERRDQFEGGERRDQFDVCSYE